MSKKTRSGQMAKPRFSSVALPAHDTPDIPGRSPVSHRSDERIVFSPLIRTSSTSSTTEKLGRLASLKGILWQAKKSGNPPPSGYHSDSIAGRMSAASRSSSRTESSTDSTNDRSFSPVSRRRKYVHGPPPGIVAPQPKTAVPSTGWGEMPSVLERYKKPEYMTPAPDLKEVQAKLGLLSVERTASASHPEAGPSKRRHRTYSHDHHHRITPPQPLRSTTPPSKQNDHPSDPRNRLHNRLGAERRPELASPLSTQLADFDQAVPTRPRTTSMNRTASYQMVEPSPWPHKAANQATPGLSLRTTLPNTPYTPPAAQFHAHAQRSGKHQAQPTIAPGVFIPPPVADAPRDSGRSRDRDEHRKAQAQASVAPPVFVDVPEPKRSHRRDRVSSATQPPANTTSKSGRSQSFTLKSILKKTLPQTSPGRTELPPPQPAVPVPQSERVPIPTLPSFERRRTASLLRPTNATGCWSWSDNPSIAELTTPGRSLYMRNPSKETDYNETKAIHAGGMVKELDYVVGDDISNSKMLTFNLGLPVIGYHVKNARWVKNVGFCSDHVLDQLVNRKSNKKGLEAMHIGFELDDRRSGHWGVPWEVHVQKPEGMGITVRDVLHAVYEAFNTLLTQDEYNAIPPQLHPELYKAFVERCREGPHLDLVEMKKGYRRADALRGQNYCRGIYWDHRRGGQWLMLVCRKEVILPYTGVH